MSLTLDAELSWSDPAILGVELEATRMDHMVLPFPVIEAHCAPWWLLHSVSVAWGLMH